MFNLTFSLPYYELKVFFWGASLTLRKTPHERFVKESGKRCLRGNLTWKNIKWVTAIKPSTSEAHSVLSYIRTGDHRRASIQGGR